MTDPKPVNNITITLSRRLAVLLLGVQLSKLDEYDSEKGDLKVLGNWIDIKRRLRRETQRYD